MATAQPDGVLLNLEQVAAIRLAVGELVNGEPEGASRLIAALEPCLAGFDRARR